MQTAVVASDQINTYAQDVQNVASALRAGALVVFPTETVYGVGANALLPEAVQRLRAVKERTDDQPFTVHLGQRSHAARYVSSPSALMRRFSRKCWPGPLTMVCDEPSPEATPIGRECTAQQLASMYHAGTIGLRCPDHPVATRLLCEADVPVVASSANRQGQSPPLTLDEALRDLDGRVSYAINGGRTRFDAASTIIAVSGNTWRIVRNGAIDQRTLERYSVSEILFVCTGNSCRSPMAEHMFRKALADRLGWSVEELAEHGYRLRSAGSATVPGRPPSNGMIEELARRQIDGAAHRSQVLTPELIHQAERIYVLSAEHRAAVLHMAPGAAGKVWLLDAACSIADPYGGTPDEYRRCAEQIERAVQARVEEFVHEDRSW